MKRLAATLSFLLVTGANAQVARESGRGLFLDHCAICHGDDADGAGPLASQLPLRPRNFRREPLQWGNSERSIALTVTNGRSGVMPPFAEVLTAAQVNEVARFVWGVMPDESKKPASTPPPRATPASRVFLVHQRNKTFIPNKVEARVGDTLVFVNEDEVEHEVHSLTDPESPPIQSQKPRQWDRVVLDTEGVVKFGCAIHPSMRLEVKVNPAGAEVFVSQKNQKFSPTELTVKPGTRVTFVNDDTVVHNVFSRGANFNLEAQKPGGRATVPFPDAGTYEVGCAIHPGMKLKVKVRP